MQSCAISSSSSRVCVAPVGLQGKFIISTFERGVMSFPSSTGRQAEVIHRKCRDRDGDAVREDHARAVAHVARLVVEHLVAGI